MNKDTANANCRELLDVLMAHGVETIVLSPGSRNTPLLIGASARNGLRKVIINDERTAAFTALGIGIATGKPIAIACTSGTALYNYAPAVAEAFYQHIPLIVISADRPAQWINQDDAQTLRQPGALSNIVKRSFDIYPETGMTTTCANTSFATEREWFVNRVANEAAITAMQGIPGPVHINMQFANPLNETVSFKKTVPRIIDVVDNKGELSFKTLKELAEFSYNKKIMVVAGFMRPDHKLNKALQRFSTLPNVTVLCETVSNLHLSVESYMIDSILSRISNEEKEELRPEIIISTGGSLVSRMLKEYLRKSSQAEHWSLGDTDVSSDCFQRLTRHFNAQPAAFFNGFTGAIKRFQASERETLNSQHEVSCNYNKKWAEIRLRCDDLNKKIIRDSKWSELKALAHIFRNIPEKCDLFLSNGTSVRYAQILIDRLPHACYCNRGVSGIDGSNATAFGISLSNRGMTLLITGDVSFSYCPEIMNLKRLGGDFRIIVINNSGGGIFRFIKTTRQLDIREEYFCSDPDNKISRLAETYGWKYVEAHDEITLKNSFEQLLKNKNTILEINVNPEESAETLIKYFENKL